MYLREIRSGEMKCICGQQTEEKKLLEIEAWLSNTGKFTYKAKGWRCPGCGESFVGEEDSDDACRAFEDAYQKKKEHVWNMNGKVLSEMTEL